MSQFVTGTQISLFTGMKIRDFKSTWFVITFHGNAELPSCLPLTLTKVRIVLYVFAQLSNKTTAGVRWLVSQLDRVVQPHSSTPLSLSPLSSLLVPFSKDYLVYWGSLQTSRCAHTMLWLVSRAALAITVEDVSMTTCHQLLTPGQKSYFINYFWYGNNLGHCPKIKQFIYEIKQ